MKQWLAVLMVRWFRGDKLTPTELDSLRAAKYLCADRRGIYRHERASMRGTLAAERWHKEQAA